MRPGPILVAVFIVAALNFLVALPAMNVLARLGGRGPQTTSKGGGGTWGEAFATLLPPLTRAVLPTGTSVPQLTTSIPPVTRVVIPAVVNVSTHPITKPPINTTAPPITVVQTSLPSSSNKEVDPQILKRLYVETIPKKLVNLAEGAVLILCYNRPDYLSATIKGLFRVPLAEGLRAVYISQDGDDESVSDVIKMFQKKHPIIHLKHEQIPVDELPYRKNIGTQRLARHYKWALDRVFQHNHTHAIILEDDMVVSHDILTFFEQTAPILDVDNTTWCVSSWNDLGFDVFDLAEDKLFRTSFFPGLGWMLRKALWDELSPIFPIDHWDHWMRVPTVSKGRDCIVPLLSRNENIGSHGANVDEAEWEQYLKHISWYKGKTPVHFGDLSYLHITRYERMLFEKLNNPKNKVVQRDNYDIMRADHTFFRPGHVYIFPYVKEQFTLLAETLSIYPSPKAFFKHIIVLHVNGAELILADQRRVPLLPKKLRILPNSRMKPTAGKSAGMSCYDVCYAVGKDCFEADFDFVNDCTVLSQHFRCEKGCSREWGNDIPNYVTAKEDKKNYGKCLITEDYPTCEAAHPNTMRLCPCI